MLDALWKSLPDSFCSRWHHILPAHLTRWNGIAFEEFASVDDSFTGSYGTIGFKGDVDGDGVDEVVSLERTLADYHNPANAYVIKFQYRIFTSTDTPTGPAGPDGSDPMLLLITAGAAVGVAVVVLILVRIKRR